MTLSFTAVSSPKMILFYCRKTLTNSSAGQTLGFLTFSIPKCKILRIGTSTLPQIYTLNGISLDKVCDMRDLDVIMDGQLKFHSHTTHVVSKANHLLGLIKKSFEHIIIHTLPLLYKSLVRPTLEYGNSIWSPHYLLD